MKEALLIVVLLWLTDMVKSAGVSDLFKLHEKDIAHVRDSDRGQDPTILHLATGKPTSRELYIVV